MPALGLARGVVFQQYLAAGGSDVFGSFEDFLKDCGALVGDYGQEDRPILDNLVLDLNGVDQYALAENQSDVLPLVVEMDILVNDLDGFNGFYGTTPVGNTSSYDGVAMGVGAFGQVEVRFGNGTSIGPSGRKSFTTPNGVISPNEHYRIKFTINSFDEVSITVNGVDQSLSITGSATSYTPLTSTHSIGGVNTDKFEGQIANVNINDEHFYELNGDGLDSIGDSDLTLVNAPQFVNATFQDYEKFLGFLYPLNSDQKELVYAYQSRDPDGFPYTFPITLP